MDYYRRKLNETDLVYLLNEYRKVILQTGNFPGLRNQLISLVASQDEMLKSTDKTLDVWNQTIQNLDVSSIEEKLFTDFVEIRDLTKDLQYFLKRTIDAEKDFIEILSKQIFWAEKRQ